MVFRGMKAVLFFFHFPTRRKCAYSPWALLTHPTTVFIFSSSTHLSSSVSFRRSLKRHSPFSGRPLRHEAAFRGHCSKLQPDFFRSVSPTVGPPCLDAVIRTAGDNSLSRACFTVYSSGSPSPSYLSFLLFCYFPLPAFFPLNRTFVPKPVE